MQRAWFGNAVADVLAEIVCEKARPVSDTVLKASEEYRTAFWSIFRNASIEALCMQYESEIVVSRVLPMKAEPCHFEQIVYGMKQAERTSEHVWIRVPVRANNKKGASYRVNCVNCRRPTAWANEIKGQPEPCIPKQCVQPISPTTSLSQHASSQSNLEAMQSTIQPYLQACKQITRSNRQTNKLNRQQRQKIRIKVEQAMPLRGEVRCTDSPRWVCALYHSHCLYYVGGFVFCRQRAKVTSSPKACKLMEECAKHYPLGSKRMLNSLQEGKLSKGHWARKGCWPNGEPASRRMQLSWIGHSRFVSSYASRAACVASSESTTN